jgi:hypothetical protein
MAKHHSPEASASYTTDGNVQVHIADERGCASTMIITAEMAEALGAELVHAAQLSRGLVELFGAARG